MRKQIIAIVAAIGIAFAAATPAKAWYGGWGYGGWGGYGWGGYGAAVGVMAGAALLGGVIASQAYAPYYGYGYGYGYPYYTAPVYAAPVYAAPVAVPAYRAPSVRKQIIIKNSPGAQVYEEDDIFGGW